ncbi:MAG: S41 family peptidase [Flavobacteriaceae bacterium]
MTYKKKYLPLIIGLTLAIGFWLGGLFHFNTDTTLLTESSNKQKLNRLIDYIDYEYVDDVNTDSIVDHTVNKILGDLDPHSVYIPKKNLEEVTETMNGEFVGIGVSFYVRQDTISVIRTIAGGPSKKAGVKAGDKILLANNDTLYGAGITNAKVVRKLKGEIDSKVTLTIYRASENRTLKLTIKRGVVALKSVPIAYMVQKDLGYIKIDRFAETTYNEFRTSLLKLKRKGMTSLVLDLRGNPGGFLDRAQEIVDEFLEDDKLILFTKNKKGEVKEFFATSKGNFEQGQVFVLIDEESASASEIVAGALQDNDKGVIVGRRSFGKGLVQREMDLGDGSAIRLTVSRYYTPTGRSIQKPYDTQSRFDYYDEYTKRYISGELTDSSRIEVADSLKFTTPKGKIVYGGGGIIPDVFVPINADNDYEKVAFAVNSVMVDNFTFDLLEKDREHYAQLNEQDFIENFVISDDILAEYKSYVRIRTRNQLIIDFNDYDQELRNHLKAGIATQLFDANTAAEIKNADDKMLQKVIEILNK